MVAGALTNNWFGVKAIHSLVSVSVKVKILRIALDVLQELYVPMRPTSRPRLPRCHSGGSGVSGLCDSLSWITS